MTIDVSTPEARKAILSELERLRQTPKRSGETVFIYPEDSWLCQNGEDTIEAAFARVAELEDLARDLVQSVHLTLRCESVNAPDAHCAVAGEHRAMLEANLDRARAVGVLP